DLVGLRVITENIKECYAVLGLVHALWRPIPGKFKDYIAMPKPNRYQSLHTTVSGPRGQRVEVQIRTQEMEQIAENGIAAHWQYKEVGASKASHMEDHLSWIRRMLEDQKDIKDPRAFLDSFKVDLYFQEVFVFTPQGDVIAMQQGATPVDMAYQVHTDIGHHCAGAKVNGKQAPLRYKLKNGDQVEIITSKHKHPSRDWLSFVKTSKARYKISNFLNQRQKERSLSLGKDLLEKEIRKFGLEPAQVLKGTQLDEAIHACGFNSLDTLQVSIGYGKTSVRRALEKLIPRDLLREQEDKAVEIKAPSTSPKDPIKVRDFDDDILIRMGKCCAPLPGDPITGYITRGRGISVHHTACPSVAAFTLEAERLVDVVWDTPEKATFATRIAVVTADRPGQLARISNAFAECDVNITRADVRLGPQKKAYFDLTVEIRNLEHLTKTLHKVRQVGGVLNVERIQNFRKPRKEKGELGEGQGPSTESEQPGLLIN
ncbi:MAG: RelA/SpoT family protein, partial [Nitrospinaceae bacterium]